MRPKGSAEALEVRRRLAANLIREGKGLCEVARLVGASPSSVHRWKEALKRGGKKALAAKPHPGPRPRLGRGDKRRLVRILQAGPRAAGFSTDLWTLARVAEVIAYTFGVRYHPGHVWHLLRSLDWSLQKPERRARERDEQAIARWRQKDWPRIKKSPAPGLEPPVY
jgi:transposase